MKITHGLLSGQVLQRDKRCRASASIKGVCSSNGELEYRVLKGAKGTAWLSAGIAQSKVFEVELKGIKTGGPYVVQLRIRKGRRTLEKMQLDDIFVGDVWILAGQSNMEGVGNLEHAPKPHQKIRAFYMRDEWDVAKEPIHYLGEAVDSFHNEYGSGPGRPSAKELARRVKTFVKGMSPGHAFAIDMYKRTKVPQGLIACAHGGTSMSQWSPKLRSQGGASLYGAMMRRYEKLGQKVAGVLWYQGESDANYQDAALYTERMVELIDSVRRDMDIPRLPWLIVQLGCHAAPEDDSSWNSVQEQQRLLPQKVKYLDVAPAIDLELDDGIHIGGKGQLILGRRLARIAHRLVHKTPGVKPGIVLKKIELIRTPEARPGEPCTSVKITYGNVAGRLESAGRPNGFALINSAGENIRGIFKTSLKGKSVILHTNSPKMALERLSISYGYGRYPLCNITDSEQMSIPVIQALPIEPEHTQFFDKWQVAYVSNKIPLGRTSYNKAQKARGWRKAPMRTPYGVLPKPVDINKVGLFVFRSTVKASEDMEALLLLGANIPFKFWLNGKLVVEDPKADMPVDPGQYTSKVRLKKGKNTLVAAVKTHNPASHYGICVRLGSLDEKRDDRISF